MQPLGLRIHGGGTKPSRDEDIMPSGKFGVAQVHKIGSVAKRPYDIGKGVAFGKIVHHAAGGCPYGLDNDGNSSGFTVVIADSKRNTLARLISADNQELARKRGSRHARSLHHHLADGRVQHLFAKNLVHLKLECSRCPRT